MGQKEWIDSTGFGKLLSFRLKKYPLILGYNLVSNFDLVSCSLSLDGKDIAITEKDVNEILGLPNGGNKFFFYDRALPTKLVERYESPKYTNWMVFSMRKIELFIVKSETLVEGGLKTITADTEDFNSWKDEDEENDEEEHQNDQQLSKTDFPVKKDTTEKNNSSDKNPELLKNTVEQLEESLSTFEKWSDNFVDLIKYLSTEFKEEERVVTLKDKFVDLNNAANWVAETVSKNPIGSMYVERLNAATLERR
ncbi:hypothetical protein POM88_045113 [Heracleum sosnowskyi]|uniref:Uncharacterized protein n=1 Tax=Heracleum sosnowskyi TaxID=360622 RepID=A0AAD8H561_9APIA|nr:hypothetical protein POM88_045113 [Heracleum sosnowskyi]